MTAGNVFEPKRARRDWTLGEQLWFLDSADINPKNSSAYLGRKLAHHLNDSRPHERGIFRPPSKHMGGMEKLLLERMLLENRG
jgi:hypothetical protein